MKTHKLKCWTIFFEKVISGAKRFEIRVNDRDYRVGDILVLQDYDPSIEEYSGREYTVVVTYMTDFGCRPGFVCMSIEPCTVIVKTEMH